MGHAKSECIAGFGLGLSIAKDLVDVSFGELTVESEVDHGSTFSFTLPVADPMEVARRYVERLSRDCDGSFKTSLICATLPPDSDARANRDCESFLNYVLRADDLLFRLADYHWILLLATGSSGARQFCARAAENLANVSRNRPQGALPAIEFARLGSWRASSRSRDKLLLKLNDLMHVTEIGGNCSSSDWTSP